MPWNVDYSYSNDELTTTKTCTPFWYDIYGDTLSYWVVGTKIAKANTLLVSRNNPHFRLQLRLQIKKIINS